MLARLRALILQHPTYGYRWLHVMIRQELGHAHDRECVGYELSLRARANEAERALETACFARLGTLRPKRQKLVLRSDNGLVFHSRRFRAACADYHLTQEYITPYTPEQNDPIERFFRTLKEECVWQHNFPNFLVAKATIEAWINHDNNTRIHNALDYRSPRSFRTAQQRKLVA